MKKRKVKLGKNFYAYKGGLYVREKLASDRGCTDEYRVKEIKPRRKLLLCIRKKEGKKGGQTKAVALLRRIDIDLREYKSKEDSHIRRAIKKFRELKQKLSKK